VERPQASALLHQEQQLLGDALRRAIDAMREGATALVHAEARIKYLKHELDNLREHCVQLQQESNKLRAELELVSK
jgi:chromosome segregation ATPase